jgi:hypothetical protein
MRPAAPDSEPRTHQAAVALQSPRVPDLPGDQPVAAVPQLIDMQLQLARQNANPDLAQGPWWSDVEAAEWIRSHAPPDLVIMARKQDLVFHYTRRRVVFFPPLSDPDKLMDGIRRRHVGLIVVVARKTPLLEPAGVTCFRSLLKTYQSSFRLIYSRPESSIYEVAATGGPSL